MSNKKNAVKLLSKIDSIDNYVILYTEFDGFFDIGDRLYIMAIDTSSDEYQYLDSINNYNSTSDKMGFVVLDKIRNSIKINRKYNEFTKNINSINSDCYISTVYIKNSSIKTGYINASLLNNVMLDTTENNKLRIIQCVLAKLNGSVINNTILEKKYNKKDLILKTEIIDNKVESYYTYNNYDNGLTIINLSDNRLDINGTDIYDGIINNCDIYTDTSISNLPNPNNLLGHWSLDELDGKIISGNLNKNIVLNSGNILVDGISNNGIFRSLPLDESGIGVLNGINLENSNTFSISIWFKLERYNGYDISLYTTSVLCFRNNDYKFGIYIDSPGDSPILNFGITDNNELLNIEFGIEYGKWYHCVFVNDSGLIKQYINNELKSELNNTINYSGIFDMLIGYSMNIPREKFSSPFRGIIDEIRVYDKVLTDDEIKSLYDNPGGDFSLKKYIHSGLLNNCNIDNGYIVKGGTFNNCTVSDLTKWEYGKWVNSYNEIENNPFKSNVWEDGIWEGGRFPDILWKNGRFISGTFNGIWDDGVFINGTFKDSNWNNGIFNNGLFENSNWSGGTFNNGTFENSNWSGGTFNNGTFENSDWYGGTFHGGQFENSKWYDGTFNNGTFKESDWSGGTFNNGTFEKSDWYNGTFHGGQFINNSKWYDGKFYHGSIFSSDWYGGEMHYGTSNGINWYNGIWYDGIVNDIEWHNGIWYGGVFNYGNFRNGEWYGGSFNGGYFGVRNSSGNREEPYPIWYNGEFYYGQFNGIWSGGTFYIGDLKEGENLIPNSYYIGYPYVQYNKKIIENDNRYNKKIPKLRRF